MLYLEEKYQNRGKHPYNIPLYYEIFPILPYLYTTQRVAEGIMLLTRPSVSQSVSLSVLFFLSALLLWNRSTEFREALYNEEINV